MAEERPLHKYTAHLNANELVSLILKYRKVTIKAVNADSARDRARKLFESQIKTEVAHLEHEGLWQTSGEELKQ